MISTFASVLGFFDSVVDCFSVSFVSSLLEPSPFLRSSFRAEAARGQVRPDELKP